MANKWQICGSILPPDPLRNRDVLAQPAANSQSKNIWNVYERWAWFTVCIIWGVAFCFSAGLVITTLVNLFTGDEANC
jgi:hypothetical protein